MTKTRTAILFIDDHDFRAMLIDLSEIANEQLVRMRGGLQTSIPKGRDAGNRLENIIWMAKKALSILIENSIR